MTPTGTLTPSATPTATRTPRNTRTATTTPNGTPTITPTATQTKLPTGRITYTLANAVYRTEAQPGATPQNISAALDARAPGGGDRWLNTSPDGAWLLLETGRFGCADWACLAIVAGDLSTAEAIEVVGQADPKVHGEGFAAVASSGNLVIYSTDGNPGHLRDLWAVSRVAGNWVGPQLLTGASPYIYNHQPAISDDGSKVLFDCGNQPYAGPGTAICEVGTNGAGFRVVLTPADSPVELPQTGALNHPDYGHDGSIIFEADWEGPQIWRLPIGGGEPVRLNADFVNENSPCVLPDGRIASTWGNAPDNPDGRQELKVMAASGNSFNMVQTDINVLDYIGIGCGQ